MRSFAVLKAGGFSGHYIKIKRPNIIEKDNCSQQVLKFVTIKAVKGVTSPCQKNLPTADFWLSH